MLYFSPAALLSLQEKIICDKISSGLFEALCGPKEPERNPAYFWFRVSKLQNANMLIFILCIKETG